MADTLRAAMLTGYADLARSVGLDPLRMLDAVGIPRDALQDPDLRISTVAARELLEQSSRAAEDFALRLYDLRTPSLMGPLLLIAREQPTVRAVLEALNRHHSLHTDVTTLRLEDTGEVVIVHVIQTWPSPGSDRQSVELSMSQVTRILRFHLGANWRPLGVSFVHAPPRVLDSHHRIFGPNLFFDQAFNGLVCDRADIDRPNPRADPEMARQIERYIEGLGGGGGAGLEAQVREFVQSRLASGKCTVELAARQLGLDLRTLQRQLAAAGTSFVDIVQGVRTGLIPQYLEDSDRPLAEVAELLGFSALSAFSRWHKTHDGRSPSARREAARARREATLSAEKPERLPPF